jgi:heme/copper-type cytochrome/quinol oxidase subunit 2
MIRLLSYLAGLTFFSGLLLLLIDHKIFSANGWVREAKASFIMGWIYTALSVLILIIGMLIYV